MTYRRLWLALAVAGMPGMALAETITFNPPDGSERTYHLEMSVRFGNPDDPGYFDDTNHISALTRFVANGRNADDQFMIDIYPLWTVFDSGMSTFSTALGDIPDDATDLLREGFTALVDLDEGRLVDFSARGGGEMPDQMVGQITEQFEQPVPPVAIEAEEGWSTTADLELVRDVDVTVTKVTPDQVFVRYNGAGPFRKLSGVSVLDRETGWVERSVMTYETLLDIEDKDGDHIRQTLAMAPADYPKGVYADFARDEPEWYPMPEGPLPPPEPVPDATQIFAHPFGTADKADDDALSLTLGHTAAIGDNIGRFEIHDVRLFEGERPLETRVITSEPITFPGYGDDPFQTYIRARPTGIGDAREDLARATEVRADIDWYPPESFVLTLQPEEDGNARVSRDGVTATLSPADEGYELLLSGGPSDYFNWSFPEGSDVQGMIYAGDRGADWLTPTESQVRLLATPDQNALLIALKADEMPDEIRVRVNRFADEPAMTRQVGFLTERGERLNPDSEPKKQLLFRDGEPVALEDIAPEGLESAALRFRLPMLQAEHCDAQLAEPAPLAGHALTFVQKAPDGSGYQGTRLLELQTEDGIRTHFYDHGTVEAVLECDSTLVWKDAGITPDSERPWQIEPEMLGVDPSMTIAEFNDHFRLVDKNDAALALVSPDSGRLWMDDTIADALFEGGYFRAAGKPARILEAVVEPEPVTRRFTVTFPELPAPIPAPEEQEDAQ
ncbi:hypothetical protein [Martelella mangrovi]|uniref:Uncharacterized protein n=1 Tax=Martelella mangrovi TaxID=1397477 RepID=A0ABV2IHT8_9HYPH